MHPELSPGSPSSRYIIERELGHGGMGVVYEARDLERNTRVALKALNTTDALNIYRLKNEFRQLADVSHPNLVSLHELCFDGDKWFFTMELVDGKSFDEYVAGELRHSGIQDRNGRSTIAQRRRVALEAAVTLSQPGIGAESLLPRVSCNLTRLRSALRQLVEAITALHAAGKLHRDIKPSNVLVTPEGRVVVLDFGLVSSMPLFDPEARDVERTIGGCVFGTPAYMSPEQAAGEPVTTASDWYSVGAVLYEALTGRLPFDGTVLQILKAKEASEPVPPAELLTGVPDDLDHLCRSLLRRDPSQRPTGAEILRYLTGTSNPPPAYNARSTATSIAPQPVGELFVGREPHLLALHRAFEQVKQRKPATVLVHGNSGMGKTALVRCFANELIKREEAVVLRGRCYERESIPYKAFDDIIDALGRYMMQLPSDEASQLLPRNVHSLARLFPVLKRVKAVANAHLPLHQTDDQLELRNQAFGALKDLLLRLSDWHTLVINIDDLQWGDMDSARLLSHILGQPDAPPILFVGTYRREEVTTSPFLRHLLADAGPGCAGVEISHLAVDALPPDEAELLTKELLRGFPLANALFANTVAAESEGVPFFIGELTQHVKAQGNKQPTLSDSVSLGDVIAMRVAGMSVEAQSVLQVLSVAGRPLEQGVALDAAQLPRGDREALLSLRAARLIRTRGTRQTDFAEVYHDRVREAVVGKMPRERVRELHAAIARASETWGVGEPEQLVVHYAEAGEGGRAGETAIHAAHAAEEKLAFNRAAELYRRALEWLPASDDEQRVERRAQLQRSLGDALANAGRGAQAADAYLQAAADLRGAEARVFKRKAAQQLLRSGRTAQGTALALELLDEAGIRHPRGVGSSVAHFVFNRLKITLKGAPNVGSRTRPAPDPAALERVETLAAMFQEFSVCDILRGAVLHSDFLLAALEEGDPLHMLQALAWDVFHQSLLGAPRNERRARQMLLEVGTLREQLGTPYAAAMHEMATAAYHCFSGRYAEALAPARRAEELFRGQVTGAFWEHSWAALLRYASLEFAGNLREMADEAPEHARRASERDDSFSNAVLVMPMSNAFLMRDDPTGSLAFLNEHRSRHTDDTPTFHQLTTHRIVETLLYAGRAGEALAHIDEQWPRLRANFAYRGRFMRATCHYLRARATFAAYVTSPSPALLARVKRDIAITKQARAFSGLPAGLESAIYAHRGERKLAIAAARESLRISDADGLERFALYARWRLAELQGARAGGRELQRADDLLRAHGIARPDRWVDLLIGVTKLDR